MRTVTLDRAYHAAKKQMYKKQWLYLWTLMGKAKVEHMGTFCKDLGVSYQTFNTWERWDTQPSEKTTNKIIEYFEVRGIKAEYNLLRHNPNYLKREIRHQDVRIKETGTIVIRGGEIIALDGMDLPDTEAKH